MLFLLFLMDIWPARLPLQTALRSGSVSGPKSDDQRGPSGTDDVGAINISRWDLCRYLKKVEASVAEVKERVADGSPITLLAHSAGGWLARVYLLGYGTADIDRLITVGSPHLPPPDVCPDQNLPNPVAL